MNIHAISRIKNFVFFSVVIISIFGFSCSANEISNFCKVSLQEQADLGSLAEPTGILIRDELAEKWAGSANDSLRKSITVSLHRHAYQYFGKHARSQIGSFTWQEALAIRARQFPVLKNFVEKNKILRHTDIIFPQKEEEFLPLLAAMHHSLVSFLGKTMTRENYLLPGVFVNKHGKDGARTLRIWNFRTDQGNFYQKYETTKAYEARQVDFLLWARVQAKYGIQPVSLGTNIFIHDFYGHAFAALVHPYEELVLQRHFYSQFVNRLDQMPGAQQAPYVAKIFEIANLLFEGFELPKNDILTRNGILNASTRAKITGMADGNGLLDAEVLLATSSSLRGLAPYLYEFRRKILLDDETFYASAEFYGGDFYDVRNHYLRGDEVRNFADPEYAYGLEGLRFQSFENTNPIGEEVLRLFVAYYNAEKTGLTFESFVNAAVGARKSGQAARLAPWKDYVGANYLRSYTKPKFREVIDGITR